MDFGAWFRDWLSRQRLREPVERDGARFTAEVLARVRAVLAEAEAAGGRAERPVRPVFLRPRWVWTMAASAGLALILVVATLRHAARPQPSPPGLATTPGVEAPAAPSTAADIEALARELEALDGLRLAEYLPRDERPLLDSLLILETLGEEIVPEEPVAGEQGSPERLLEELERLDAQYLAAFS